MKEQKASTVKVFFGMILILALFLILPFVRILGQQNEFNQFVIIFNTLYQSLIAFLIVYVIYSTFIKIQFSRDKILKNIWYFFSLILLYTLLTLYITMNLFITFVNLLPQSRWEQFPEYKLFVIPSIALSMLLLLRLFSYIKNTKKIWFIEIETVKINNIMQDLLIGLIIFSVLGNIFFTVSVYPLGNIFSFEYLLVESVLTYSIIIVIIELLFWLYKNYLWEGVKLESIEFLKSNKSIIIITMFLFFGFYFGSSIIIPTQTIDVKTDTICLNTTIAKLSIIEKEDNSNIYYRNSSYFSIPLINSSNSEVPITERTKYIFEKGLLPYYYLNKTLVITTVEIPYSVRYKIVQNQTSEIIKPIKSLIQFPTKYDDMIFYALYKNNFTSLLYFANNNDYGNRVLAEKTYFDLSKKYDNIAIIINVDGGSFLINSEKITIISENKEIANNIKEILEGLRRSAVISIINQNPKVISFC